MISEYDSEAPSAIPKKWARMDAVLLPRLYLHADISVLRLSQCRYLHDMAAKGMEVCTSYQWQAGEASLLPLWPPLDNCLATIPPCRLIETAE